MREPKIMNKHKLNITKINSKLIVLNKKALKSVDLLSRNNVTKSWNAYGYEKGNSFILSIYDRGSIKIVFTAFDDMCSYNFEEFFKHESIENINDLIIQEKALEVLNELIDSKIIGFR